MTNLKILIKLKIMNKFLSVFKKELTCLVRDKMGLALLFLMPAVLVMVVTIVQDSAWEGMGETVFDVVWVDEDQSDLSREIRRRLEESPNVRLFDHLSGQSADPQSAVRAVLHGDFKGGMVIPKGAGENSHTKIKNDIETTLGLSEKPVLDQTPIQIFFDPILGGALKSALAATIEGQLQATNIKLMVEALSESLPDPLGENLGHLKNSQTLSLQEVAISKEGFEAMVPTSTQQNVPAWTLFAMFFVILPLSTGLIKEKTEGTGERLRSLPISYSLFLSGKIFIFVGVCMVQFVMMLIIGIFLLPLFGLPVFDLQLSHWPAFVVAFVAALSACGFGVLFGTVFSTQEQASTFGAIAVVLGAALGGIMVPVFVMPELMQTLSLISPLGWGQKAFMNIFFRGGTLGSIGPELGYLFLFFFLTLVSAIFVYARRIRL